MAELPTVMSILTTLIGRAQRADADSKDMSLSQNTRLVRHGMCEGYLQMIAMINGVEVADVRPMVFGVRATTKSKTGKHRSKV